MDPSEYKKFHESFMVNNNGTTIEDVFFTIVPTIFTTFLATNIILVSNPIGTLATFIIEFILIVFSTILHVTILNYRIWEIAFTLMSITITAAVKQLSGRYHIAPFVQIPCRRPEYLNTLRAAINLLTAVCILAVDFKCFPRKLAKTETFGFGLMDTGVGLYVYGNGLVAPELNSSSENSKITWRKLEKTLWSCLPLIVLGALRFTATNELDYQQHVSEYGVHWNFFLTLAFTKLFGTILIGILPHFEYLKYISIILLFIHESILQLGASDYVIDANNQVKRDNIFSANREGICSLMGYVSLYLASVYIGYRLKKIDVVTDKKQEEPIYTNVRQLFWNSIRLLFVALIMWKVTYILKNMFGVSRRIANMGYVFWILSIGTSVTVLFIFLEIFHYFCAFDRTNKDNSNDDDETKKIEKTVYAPIILSGINYNGLAFFLFANLLTGFVNLTNQTLLLGTMSAMMILCGYMLMLCSATTFLYLNKIKLKVW